jgi:cysteine desulfurase/selenocysteine lyase
MFSPRAPFGSPPRAHASKTTHTLGKAVAYGMSGRSPVITQLDVATIRKDFPIFESGIAYLDSANTSQRPRQVVRAMTDYFEKYNANIHRSAYHISEVATEKYEATREAVRRFLNARSTKEIIYTRGTTEGINLVAYSWGRKNIREGDLIVLTILEHHSNIVPWQILAAEKGAGIEYVDIDDKGELRLDQYQELLRRQPKMVAFNQVSNSLGTINPIAEMVAAAKAAGATVLVDGAQGAPHQGADVQALGCDFYAFSSHKICGPTGVGILYGRRELLEKMDPFMAGGDMIKAVRLQGTTYNDLPWRFEAGTQAIAEVIGLGRAIEYVSGLGMDAIRRHEKELAEYAWESLSAIDGVTLYGPPPDRRAGVVSFSLAGVHPHDLATIADRSGVCLRAGHHCTMPLMARLDVPATARASFYVYTLPEEIDRLAGAVEEARRIFS